MSADTRAASLPNPALIFDMLQAHQRTAALKAAIDLGVFGALGDGPSDVASIAKKCAASERGIAILCDFLTLNGMLTKKDGRYLHTPTSATFLDPRSPACMASMAQFLGSQPLLEPFRHLAEIVRTGHTSLPGEGTVEGENPVWVEFAENMAPMAAAVAGPMAALLLDGKTGPVRVLDMAAGHGLFGIAFAQQNPQAKITALDWGSVLKVAERNSKKAGVDGQIELLPGSAFDVPFGGPYDFVLLTNFLHHFDPPTNVTLLKKVHAALAPGGRAALLEFVPNDDRVSPPMAAAFAMTMLTTTASGNAYTLREYTVMFKEAGFAGTTSHILPMSPGTIVVGQA